MRRTDIQLAEYAEAGAACRAHESHVRTALGAYIAVAVALIAIEWNDHPPRAASITISLIGFAVGLLVVTVILRHRNYYHSYMRRAQQLEKNLGMVLHTRAWSEVKANGSSNKYAVVGIALIFCLYFLISAFVYAFRGQ